MTYPGHTAPPALPLPADLSSRPRRRRQIARALTLGLLRPGAADWARREHDLYAQITARISGARPTVVLGCTGGAGRSTLTALLTLVLTRLRQDRVAAIDATTNIGTLASRLARPPVQTVRAAAAGAPAAAPDGPIDLYGAEPRPWQAPALILGDVLQATRTAQTRAGLVLIDADPTITRALTGSLGHFPQAVVVTAADPDSQTATIALLDAIGSSGSRPADLLVVVNHPRPGPTADTDGLRQRSRAVHVLPFDPALAAGGPITLGRLAPATRGALLALAADLISGGQPQPGPMFR